MTRRRYSPKAKIPGVASLAQNARLFLSQLLGDDGLRWHSSNPERIALVLALMGKTLPVLIASGLSCAEPSSNVSIYR